jgi:uroporphyrinogen-III synthase
MPPPSWLRVNPMAHNPVVITRPLTQADSLAQRVNALGRQAIVFPLLEIHPLKDQAPLRAALKDLTDYAMVAFVSPNAIDAAFAVLHASSCGWPDKVALAVMGEGSRHALARHGLTAANTTIVSPLDVQRTDSNTLLEALDIHALTGKKVLIVRGENGRELLADALRAGGVTVDQVAAYRRVAPALDRARSAQLSSMLDTQSDWLVTSSEALRILMQMVKQVAGVNGVAKMQQQKIIVPHARIVETAQMLGFRQIVRTGSGDEQLLAALQLPA